MRVTLLGHATLLVEMRGCTVLTDPVFFDPFEDGAVVACPARSIDVDAIPPYDKVVISHAHLDHFDIPSLARVPKHVEVLCPDDPTIPYVLEQLGFRNVRVIDAGVRVEMGEGELYTTSSNIDVIEFGMIFKDSSGVFWNEVDTVITPGAIELARLEMGDVDLLFSCYASQNLGFFGSMRAGYPKDVPRANVSNVLQIRPKLVVPGSAGFRFDGLLSWANPFLFPVSRERFRDDLALVAPSIPCAYANPGDTFELASGAIVRRPASASFVHMIEDDSSLVDFDATAPVPPLVDPNPRGYASELIEHEVDACFDGLSSFVEAAYVNRNEPLIEWLRASGERVSIGAVFSSGDERWLHVEFAAPSPIITQSNAQVRDALATHRIAASVLAARWRYEMAYCYYRGFSRITDLYARPDGAPDPVGASERRDLLTYYLHRRNTDPNEAARRRLDFQLREYFRTSGAV